MLIAGGVRRQGRATQTIGRYQSWLTMAGGVQVVCYVLGWHIVHLTPLLALSHDLPFAQCWYAEYVCE